jgi:2-keto-4-pentenoate hydratase/2-oxohepta-3-ene-1,7-dioic acid hydratase in catechol pathway
MPVCYKGNADAVVGPGADVVWPSYSEQLDVELEIAAVVGRRGRDLDADAAADHIAGFTLFNDFSARDTQLQEMQGNLGPAKGKDFANALGPRLVTPEEVDLASARFSITVTSENGDTTTWSEGTVGEMAHDWGEILAHASDGETLYPGDVLGSGTVGTGCGLEVGQFLQPGDTAAISVEGLGTLRNHLMRGDP